MTFHETQNGIAKYWHAFPTRNQYAQKSCMVPKISEHWVIFCTTSECSVKPLTGKIKKFQTNWNFSMNAIQT